MIFFAAPDAPTDYSTNISCMSQVEHASTIIIAFSCGLSILFVLLTAITVTAICVFVRSNKTPQRESDVYYDTINMAMGDPPPVISNVAYGLPPVTKLILNQMSPMVHLQLLKLN
jgi:hypothetical protein